jgi:mono/diheme cytochrome c family protein
MTKLRLVLVLLLPCILLAAPARAEDGQQRGKALLETLCAQCHAVGRTGESPNALAPPFRTFGDDKLYDNDFAQRLQDGLSSIHPAMPTFHFNRDDARAAVNYLRAIQVPRSRSRP